MGNPTAQALCGSWPPINLPINGRERRPARCLGPLVPEAFIQWDEGYEGAIQAGVRWEERRQPIEAGPGLIPSEEWVAFWAEQRY